MVNLSRANTPTRLRRLFLLWVGGNITIEQLRVVVGSDWRGTNDWARRGWSGGAWVAICGAEDACKFCTICTATELSDDRDKDRVLDGFTDRVINHHQGVCSLNSRAGIEVVLCCHLSLLCTINQHLLQTPAVPSLACQSLIQAVSLTLH
jgi:hypothetical protein